uniref:Nucleolar protein 6 n=1 Tax=Plectus sambesii TaxID=2011161 RepID=A0A914X0M9_9BILA
MTGAIRRLQTAMVQKRAADSDAESASSGQGDDAAAVAQPKTKKAKRLNRRKAKAGEEESLMSNDFFELEARDFLNDVTPDSKSKAKVKALTDRIEAFLLSATSEKSHKLNDWKWVEKFGLAFPLNASGQRAFADSAAEYKFVAPETVSVVGSWLLDTATKPLPTVDLLLTLPQGFYGSRDFLNHIYHTRRAQYLCSCLIKIKQRKKLADEFSNFCFEYLDNDPMRPVVVLIAKELPLRIRLLCSPGALWMKPSRFRPENSNLRPSWYFESTAPAEVELPPTPHYNSSILADVLLLRSNEHFSKTLANHAEIKKAMRLLTFWLRQRELNQRRDGFSNFLLTAWMAYCLKANLINERMNYRHVLESVWKAFVQVSWLDTNISLADEVNATDDEVRPTIEQFRAKFEMVFVDSTGYLNLAANLSRYAYDRLRNEAAKALAITSTDPSNAFNLLFIEDVPFQRTFDQYFRIDAPDALRQYALSSAELKIVWMDRDGDTASVVLPNIAQLLSKGLTDRVQVIDVQRKRFSAWKCSDSPPNGRDCESLLFGVCLDQDTVSTALTRGPPANDEAAKQFRQLWGERSEMRKFADNAICEAVVWQADNARLTRLIPAQIVKHLLNLHFSIPPKNVRYIATQVEDVVSNETVTADPTGERRFEDIGRSFEKLSQSLRLLQNLPLGVAGIQAMSPIARKTEPFPPAVADARLTNTNCATVHDSVLVPKSGSVAKCPPFLPSLQVFLTLETSGKWSEDLKAFRRLKTAFYLQMSEQLQQQFQFHSTAMVDGVLAVVDGTVFFLQIAHAKEVHLLKKAKYEGGTLLKETAESKALEKEIVDRPKIVSCLQSVSQQHAAFALTCRLAKRWLAGHLLSGYLADEAVELIVASLFVNPAPFAIPGSGLVGFIRFLHLLANHDWLTSPVLVNFTSSWSATKLENVRKQFIKLRPTLPTMCLCTPDDETGARWTRQQPIPMIVNRLAKLASTSMVLFEKRIVEGTPVDLSGAFKPSLSGYHVLIRLHGRNIARRPAGDAAESEAAHANKLPVVDFDPVALYVNELRIAFEHMALFFYDGLGGDIIGVLWKPTAKDSCDLKVTRIPGRVLVVEEEPKLQTNFSAALEDFKMLGRG